MATLARLMLLFPAVLTAQQYFPPGLLDPQKVDRYSRQLKAMREPSLYELSQQDPNAKVYRFLWLRSFHHPIAIRLVVRKNGSGWINVRMTTGNGWSEPGRISRYGVSWLTKGKTQALLNAYEGAGFWNLTTLPETTSTVVQNDGAQWIIEGVRAGKYHVIERWSPQTGDPVHAIGTLALKLARFRIRPSEMY
jgi:hypothetical protein